MRKLLFLALIAFGGYKAYSYYIQSGAAAFDESGKPQTLIFTFNGCPPCNDAIKLLQQRGVAFNEYNIANNAENQKLMHGYGGSRRLPYIVSGNRSMGGYQKDELIGMLAEVYGNDVLTRKEQKLMSHNFDANGSPIIVMYSTQICPYCKKTREYLDKKGVQYIERDINNDSAAQRDYKALNGAGTPLIYVGYRRVVGFDESKLSDAIKQL